MNPTRLSGTEYFHESDIPLKIIRRNPQEPFPLHTHDFNELVIVLEGRGTHITEKGRYSVEAGDVYVLHGDQAHGYEKPEDFVLVNLLYRPQLLRGDLADLASLPGYHALFTIQPLLRKRSNREGRLHLSAEQLRIASLILETLEGELERKKPGYRFISVALFMQLLGFLSRCYTDLVETQPPGMMYIGKVLSYMEEYFDHPISIDRLTVVAHLSESSLLRVFRKITGSSPIEYLIRLRIRKACVLLTETDKPITMIAMDTGFSDSNYFSRQFRKVMKCSPRSFRKERPVSLREVL